MKRRYFCAGVVLAPVGLLLAVVGLGGLLAGAFAGPQHGLLPAVMATPLPADSTLLFSVPFSADGLHYWGTPGGDRGVTGLAVAGDGSLWLSDADNRLWHYRADGTLLGRVHLDGPVYYPADLKARGADLWVLDGTPGFSRLLRLTSDGTVRARYDIPESVRGQDDLEFSEKGLFRLVLGDGESVLLEKDFGTPFVQMLDADGKTVPRLFAGYPAGGRLYTAQPDGPPIAEPHTGTVTVGAVRFTVTVSGTLGGLHVFAVRPDGSFYLWLEEGSMGDPPELPETDLRHYSAAGELLERARVWPPAGYAVASRWLAFGPDGALYVAAPWPEIRDPPDRVDVRRVTFFGPDTPLPTPMPPTPDLFPPTPVPTEPPPPPLPPTATPITDLGALARQSDAIARIRVTGTNGAQHSNLYYIQVREWFKKPAQVITDTGVVWVYNPWGQEFTPPPDFANARGDEAILFLHYRGANPWDDHSPAYELTGAPEGDTSIYRVKDDKILYAGIPQYQGWAVADFAAAIRAALAPPQR